MLKIIKKCGKARLSEFQTVHGIIKLPGFMNVATAAAIKGGLDAYDLQYIDCQVMLCNTYHLSLRPGADNIYTLGGLHKFTGWQGPILTDSGGFQVFSLSSLRKIEEQGVTFASHIDGKRIFMGPEESMEIQSKLASTIAMAFDECVENPAPRDYVEKSAARTTRWLKRCIRRHNELNADENTINKNQMLFGINQGGTYPDIRIAHMKEIAELDGLDGFAIGGLAVGESTDEMYNIIDCVEPYMPADKPRYLMGVGTPLNILEAVHRGVDLFDCVMPSRNARHGHLFTHDGIININNQKYQLDESPIDSKCFCPTCQKHSRAYVRHLIRSGEILGMRLAVIHNLYFYNHFMEEIRQSLENDTFEEFYRINKEIIGKRI